MSGFGASLGLLFLRLAVGGSMAVQGCGKVFGWPAGGVGMADFQRMLYEMGFPGDEIVAGLHAHELAGWLVGIGELGGGVLIVLGVLTRFCAFWQAVILGGALYLAHREVAFQLMDPNTTSALYTLVLFLGALALMLLGSGALAVAPGGGREPS